MKLVTTLLTGALFVGALGTGAYAMTDKQPTAAQTNAPSPSISESQAKEMALNATKGEVTKFQLDDGRKEYEMEIVNQDTEYDVKVDASTGKVLEMKLDDHGDNRDDDDKELQTVSPKISLEEAKKIALDKEKGTVTEAKLDNDYNRLVYEIGINTADHGKVEVKVDASNGKVLKVEIDD